MPLYLPRPEEWGQDSVADADGIIIGLSKFPDKRTTRRNFRLRGYQIIIRTWRVTPPDKELWFSCQDNRQTSTNSEELPRLRDINWGCQRHVCDANDFAETETWSGLLFYWCGKWCWINKLKAMKNWMALLSCFRSKQFEQTHSATHHPPNQSYFSMSGLWVVPRLLKN